MNTAILICLFAFLGKAINTELPLGTGNTYPNLAYCN